MVDVANGQTAGNVGRLGEICASGQDGKVTRCLCYLMNMYFFRPLRWVHLLPLGCLLR
jgi:hypothetical protein